MTGQGVKQSYSIRLKIVKLLIYNNDNFIEYDCLLSEWVRVPQGVHISSLNPSLQPTMFQLQVSLNY